MSEFIPFADKATLDLVKADTTEVNTNLGDITDVAGLTSVIALLKQINSNFPIAGGTDLSVYKNRFAKYYSTSVTSGIYSTILDITGQGFLETCIFTHIMSVSNNKNIHIKITLDGTVIFDKGITNTDTTNNAHAFGIVNELLYNTGDYASFVGPSINGAYTQVYMLNSSILIPSNFTDGSDSSYSYGSTLKGFALKTKTPLEFKNSLLIEVKSFTTTIKGLIEYATA